MIWVLCFCVLLILLLIITIINLCIPYCCFSLWHTFLAKMPKNRKIYIMGFIICNVKYHFPFSSYCLKFLYHFVYLFNNSFSLLSTNPCFLEKESDASSNIRSSSCLLEVTDALLPWKIFIVGGLYMCNSKCVINICPIDTIEL